MEEREHLVDRLAVVGLVEQPIELRRRRTQPPDDLPAAQPAARDPLLRFDRQSMEDQVSQVGRILVVLKDLLDMNCVLGTGAKDIREALAAYLRIWKDPHDRVPRGGPDLEPGVREPEHSLRRADLEALLPVVEGDATNFHRIPLSRSAWMSTMSLRGASPSI